MARATDGAGAVNYELPVQNSFEILSAIAAGQLGLITRVQLLAIGISPSGIKRLVASGLLRRMLPCVYVLAGVPYSWDQGLLAAVYWGGEGSAAAGRAAAKKHGFVGLQGAAVEIAATNRHRRTDVLLPTGARIIVHRYDENLLKDIEYIGPLAITSVRRTILDLAGMKHPRAGRALDDAIFRKQTTLGEMWTLYEEEWTRGRRGIEITREMLKERMGGWEPTQTVLEDLFLRIVDEFALPTPKRQYPLVLIGEEKPCRFDFAYPEAKMIIECDSRSWHSSNETRDRDREKDQKLSAMRLLPVRYTHVDLQYRQAHVAETTRSTYNLRVSERGVAHSGPPRSLGGWGGLDRGGAGA